MTRRIWGKTKNKLTSLTKSATQRTSLDIETTVRTTTRRLPTVQFARYIKSAHSITTSV